MNIDKLLNMDGSVLTEDFAKLCSAYIAAGGDVDVKNADGKTMMMNASFFAEMEVVCLLVEEGADVNLKDSIGYTALMYATDIPVDAAAEVIELLVDAGASINETNIDGETALMMSVTSRNLAQTKMLLNLGADSSIRNNAGKTVFDLAQEYYQEDVANLLSDHLLWQRHGHSINQIPVHFTPAEYSF